MTLFAIFAALLLGISAAFLLPPLWRQRQNASADARKAANLAIFRDQLAELEREQAEGSLAEADFAQARAELQKRLLEEVETEGEAPVAARANERGTAIALLVLLPVLALAGYALLGNLPAVDPASRESRPQMTPEQINGMVARLAERQQANPDDMQGWLMLGRSYKALGRYDDAVAALAKAEKVINEDPELLAGYAETIVMAQGQSFKGKPRQLIDRALKLDPQHPHSLFLAGAAAMEAGERAKVVAYWEKLLPLVEPGSEVEKMLRQGIAKAKEAK